MKKMMRASCAFAMLLSACASPMQQAERSARQQQAAKAVPQEVTVPFDENQAKAAMAKGKGTIKGVLYHKVNLSGQHAGSDPFITHNPPQYLKGVTVRLFPVTAHLQEVLSLEKENRRQRSRSKDVQAVDYIADPRMHKYSVSTKTDEYGRYFFNGLKPGKYFVVANNVDVRSTGVEVVQDGASVNTNPYFGGQTNHYRTQTYGVLTQVEYDQFVELEPGKNELELESRMRHPGSIHGLFGF
jgi:hypothetical protein